MVSALPRNSPVKRRQRLRGKGGQCLVGTVRLRAFVCLSALLAVASPGPAWDSPGHMIVTQIAREELSPQATQAIDAALARFNAAKSGDFGPAGGAYDFVTAACWMDDIRALRDKYDFGPWHYVNLPFTPDGLPLPPESEGMNVIRGVQRCTDIIAGRAVDPDISPDQALVMLLHLVGDVHQPLHTTNRGGDLGGNLVLVPNLELTKEEELFGRGKVGNLHAFWDSAYRRGFRGGKVNVLYERPIYTDGDPASGHLTAMDLVRRESAALRAKFPDLPVGESTDPADWAKESHEIGYETGYGKLPSGSPTGRLVKLDERYVNAARGIAEERLVLAGRRLAALLNTLYASPAASP